MFRSFSSSLLLLFLFPFIASAQTVGPSQDVSLIAEPNSSVPLLYPGKSVVPLEGTTRVVAVASFRDSRGKTLDPNTLLYEWTVDDVQIGDGSGIGKSAIIVTSPLQYRERLVSINVKDSQGNLLGQSTLDLQGSEPVVRLYANDPLLGIDFNNALSGTYEMGSSETSLYAAAFYFPSLEQPAKLQWFLNGSPAQTGNEITLRPIGNGSGSASISFSASAGESTTATTNLSLTFGAQKSNFLPSL